MVDLARPCWEGDVKSENEVGQPSAVEAGEGVVQGGKVREAQQVLQWGRGRVNPLAKGLALGGPRKTAKALWGRQADCSRQLHQETQSS